MAGLYVAEDPGAIDDAVKKGSLSLRFGLGGCCAQRAGETFGAQHQGPILERQSSEWSIWRPGLRRFAVEAAGRLGDVVVDANQDHVIHLHCRGTHTQLTDVQLYQ